MNKNIRTVFENIKKKYGDVASWAIWKDPDGNKLASNMEVEGLFDLEKKPEVLDQINTNIIMCGLNFYIPLNNPPKLANFHTYDGSNINHITLRNASKIRYAFKGTPYWGAYMTDIIKNYAESRSERVVSPCIDIDFKIFRQELETLHADRPTIIAFGGKVYNLLNEHLNATEYSRLIKVTHYAYYSDGCATHEGYRSKVLKQLKIV